MSDSIKSIIVTSGAMFALIFGAGNLILPPQLGAQFSSDWILTSLGFTLTAIVFPVLGFVAHARNQGGVHGLALPMGRIFSWMFPLLIYLIAVALPGPRTASVTYEVGVKPLFSMDAGVFSFFYFAGVLLIGWFRSSLLQFMGKFLNPLLVLTILTLIVASLFLPGSGGPASPAPPLVHGIVEGYQTYDALASMVIGGVILVSLRVSRPDMSRAAVQKNISISGIIAGAMLMLVYWGLIYGGTRVAGLGEGLSRTELLRLLSAEALGADSVYLLSSLVSLACFSTACGVSIGAADFMAELIGKRPRLTYRISLASIALLGWLIGSWEADTIVNWGYPVLLLIYPATVVLIVLTILPPQALSTFWFRLTLWVCVVFSIPDVWLYLDPSVASENWIGSIPGAGIQMGWVLPSLIVLGTGLAARFLKA